MNYLALLLAFKVLVDKQLHQEPPPVVMIVYFSQARVEGNYLYDWGKHKHISALGTGWIVEVDENGNGDAWWRQEWARSMTPAGVNDIRFALTPKETKE